MIISALSSLLLSPNQDVTQIVKSYPRVEFVDDSGKKQSEIMNRYFIMFGDEKLHGRTKEDVEYEKKNLPKSFSFS